MSPLRFASARVNSIFNLSSISFFALGLFGYVLRSINYFSAVPGDFGDDRFNSVILEHLFRWVAGREEALWNPTFFYPFEHVLAFGDNHFGSGIFYILLRLLGLSREVALDGWYLIGFIVSYFCACWAFRRIGFSQLSSAAGAFVFCFSLPVLHTETHVQLTYRFAIPLAFAAFWDLIKTKRLFLLWQVVFWTTIQFFCSIYLGLFLVYLLSATAIAWLIVAEKKGIFSDFLPVFQKEERTVKIFFGVAIIASISMLVGLLYKYYATKLEYSFGIQPLFLPMLFCYYSTDNLMFFGCGVWILCLLGVVVVFLKGRTDKIGMIAVISFLLLFVVTLAINDHPLYNWLFHIPGIRAVRNVHRIALVMLLPIGILVAVGVQAVQSKTINASIIKRTLLVICLLGLLGTEVIVYQPKNIPIDVWQTRKNTLLRNLPVKLPSHPIIFVTIKDDEPFYSTELDGMILAQDMGVPTLNGYTGNIPPGYSIPSPCYSYLNRLYSYAAFRKLPLSAVGPLAQRVVIIAPTPCAHEPAIGFCGDINPAQAKDIVLRIIDVKKEKNVMTSRIVIRNDSSSVFHTMSLNGKPVRLSWRFVPLSPTGERFSEPGWETGKDISWMLSPHESIIERIDATLPKVPRIYLFEVSLVQEGVAWFHDLGMQVARTPIEVESWQE